MSSRSRTGLLLRPWSLVRRPRLGGLSKSIDTFIIEKGFGGFSMRQNLDKFGMRERDVYELGTNAYTQYILFY